MEIIFTKNKRRSEIKTYSDEQKINAIFSRDEEATRAIYHLYRDEFLNFLRKIHNGDKNDLLDIYSDAFIHVCNKIYFNELTLTSSLKTYLFGVGRNMMMEYLRKRNKNQEIYQSEIKDEVEEDYSIKMERERIVQEELKELGEPCVSILTLKFWNNLSGEEIAEELEFKNADVVKTRRYKCIQQLRKKIELRIYNN